MSYNYYVKGSYKGDDPAYEIDQWCHDQFGPVSDRWNVDLSGYYFKNEEDHSWFMLRWSHEVLE
jgi:hypothetical protein